MNEWMNIQLTLIYVIIIFALVAAFYVSILLKIWPKQPKRSQIANISLASLY